MADPNVVLLNDTDVSGYHFGCARVMSTIRQALNERGIEPVGSVPVSLDWRTQADLVEKADLIVINGEGTLHHNSKKGRWLLEAARNTKDRGGRVALINALWQDNPADWAELIADADILACRDSRSAAALSSQTGRDVLLMGDLSMCQPVAAPTQQRSGVVIGDSLFGNITAQLATLADTIPNARLIPVTSSLKFVSPNLRGIRRQMRSAYARYRTAKYLRDHPNATFLTDETAYIAAISSAEMSVTGRFHAVCLAVATRTPIVAISSNSWKIEALLHDIGLSPHRIVSSSALSAQVLDEQDWGFSPNESAAIEARLKDWNKSAKQMFDTIAGLVR